MGSIAVVIGGALFGRIVGALASIVVSIATALAYALGRSAGGFVAALFGTLIAGALALVWTAAIFLSAQWLVDNDVSFRWLVWIMAVLLSMAPIGMALQSAEKHARESDITRDQAAIKEVLQRGAGVQLLGGAAMLFSQRVWDWWSWLPFA